MANLKPGGGHGRLAAFFSGGPFPGGGRTWIMTIGVHSGAPAAGLAWRLLAEGEACLAGPTIYLTVRASNQRAYALYAQNGYTQVRIKARYYPDGEDGIEMRKDRP
jgi:ribosomal protein S18 acetylase RimI-like enzyme